MELDKENLKKIECEDWGTWVKKIKTIKKENLIAFDNPDTSELGFVSKKTNNWYTLTFDEAVAKLNNKNYNQLEEFNKILGLTILE